MTAGVGDAGDTPTETSLPQGGVTAASLSKAGVPGLSPRLPGIPRTLVDWLRFNAVGLVGVGVQLAILAALRSGLGWTLALSTVVAVECAVIHNFIWHERWTWAYRELHVGGIPGRLLRFNLSNGLISIVGNVVLMQILAARLQLNYMLANLIAILACSLLNFLVSDKLVFRQARAARDGRLD